MRGFKVAQAGLRRELEQAVLREQGLAEQLRQLPQRVLAKGVKTLKKERKLIVDAIKMTAYQLETELLGRLAKHYRRADDEGRTLFTCSISIQCADAGNRDRTEDNHCGPVIAASDGSIGEIMPRIRCGKGLLPRQSLACPPGGRGAGTAHRVRSLCQEF